MSTVNTASHSAKPDYDHRIDAIRGIACILLVAFHVIGEQAAHGLRVQPDHPLAMFAEIFIHVRMPLFAMLSGFVYAYRPAHGGQIAAYFKGKGRRLVLPYLFAATAFALINTVLGGAYAVPWGDFWQVYALSYSQFWFIQSVLTLFVVVGVMDALLGADKKWPILALLGVSCLAFLSPIGDGVIVLSLEKTFYLAPFFITGVALNRLGKDLPDVLGYVIVGLSLVGLAAHAYDTIREPGLTTDRRTLLGLFLALGLSSSLVIFRFRATWLETIGRYSYSIYLYHIFAVFGLQAAYDMLGFPGAWGGLALGVGLGLALPMAAEEMAKFAGRYLSWVPVLTLGVKPRKSSTAQIAAEPAAA
ncbi:MAG: acyltransferase [Maricaulis sp.]|nr:acyltransferase [Maricaulis sp.]